MIDVALVTRKLALILQDLPALNELARKSPEDYLASSVPEVLTERYLERVIGRMIDINYHLITELGHPPPRDYHESFVALGKLGVLTKPFAEEIALSAGLRNRLVHEYEEIDAKKVYKALQVAVLQIPVYLDAVRQFVEKLPT